MTKIEDTTSPAVGSPVDRGVRPHAEDVERVLRELDDTTNQTWRGKRARWAALVRSQEAEIARMRNELEEVFSWARIEKAPLREQEIASIARVLGIGA